MFQHVEVTEGDIKGVDVLIGMDIITQGDFIITNQSNKTVMSFRIPSLTTIDYVVEVNRENLLQTLRAQRKAKNASTTKNRKKRKKRR